MASEYRVGPSDFFTPGDLHADADTLNGQVDALDQVYESGAGNPDSDLQDAWARFTAQWRAFYSNTFGGFFTDLTAALNNSSRDQLVQFEQRFETLRSALSDAGVKSSAASAVKPKEDTSLFGMGTLGMIALILGIVLAIFVVRRT